MTLLNTDDLKQILYILNWAKDKTVSETVFNKILDSRNLVEREIKFKELNPVKD